MDSPRSYDNDEFEAAKKVILRWDSTASNASRENMIFEGNRDEIDEYLEAVDEIQWSMSSLSISDGNSEVKGVVQIAMARLEDEFRNILATYTTSLEMDTLTDHYSGNSSRSASGTDFEVDEDYLSDNEGVGLDLSGFEGEANSTRRIRSSRRSSMNNSMREVDLIPPEAIDDLRSIAQRIVGAGNLCECIEVYSSVRKPAVEASSKKLGVQNLSKNDIHRMNWGTMELEIKQWIRAVNLSIRVLFAREKNICSQIFEDLGPATADACFMETVEGSATQLFNFAEVVSTNIDRQSPEKLFKILEMHDALFECLLNSNTIFDSKSSKSIQFQAAEVLSMVAETAREIIYNFQSMILHNQSNNPVRGGTIHPLTRYVMNYINLFPDYKGALNEILVSKPSTGSNDSGDPILPALDFPGLEEKTPLDIHTIWFIVVLHSNLHVKSKHFKDESLALIFLMNNTHYIVEKVKNLPNLREMVGDHYLKMKTGEYRQQAVKYERTTWMRVWHCLRDEGLTSSSTKGGHSSSVVSKTALQERFKTFNAIFDEVYKAQCTWSIPDPRLREELRISICAKLIPAYTSFLGRFKSHIENGKHPERYIKYTVEELETVVSSYFFEGLEHNIQLKKMLSH